MSNYEKITDFTTKDSTNAIITGSDFDSEFGAVATMSATKANKAVPAVANSVAGLDSAGDLYDSTITVSALVTALANVGVPGMMVGYGGSAAPSGYLDCDGASYATASYPNLFAIIAYGFGGSGANFNVPDMRGRAVCGNDDIGGVSANVVTAAAADTMGGTTGAETHTLSEAEMPVITPTSPGTATDGAHSHTNTGASSQSNTGTVLAATTAGTTPSIVVGSGGSAHSHALTINSFGSGNAHTIMQPSIFVNYIIKT